MAGSPPWGDRAGSSPSSRATTTATSARPGTNRAMAATPAPARSSSRPAPDSLTIDADTDAFRIGAGCGRTGRLYEALGRAAYEWHDDLFATAEETASCPPRRSTPPRVEPLEAHDPLVHKIASFELVDLRAIRVAAARRTRDVDRDGHRRTRSTRRVGAAVDPVPAGSCCCAATAPIRYPGRWTCDGRHGARLGRAGQAVEPRWAGHDRGGHRRGPRRLRDRSVTHPRSGRRRPRRLLLPSSPTRLRRLVAAVRRGRGVARQGAVQPHRRRASRVFRRSLFVVADVAAGDPSAQERPLHPTGNGLAPETPGRRCSDGAPPAVVQGTLSWDLVG